MQCNAVGGLFAAGQAILVVVDDVELANYFAGLQRGDIYVDRAPRQAVGALAVDSGAPVLLSDYTLIKQGYRHREITFEDYLILPRILSSGFIIKGRKSKDVDVFDSEIVNFYRRSYRICLHGTINNTVYIVTFHKYSLSESELVDVGLNINQAARPVRPSHGPQRQVC